ncbi:MAG: ATP-dependent 6-phosphofructokinase [Elusimicrobia bacterium]|nr:ATP-dependent 6-phosphofructokinase [Elusimicrobiota bacterium]
MPGTRRVGMLTGGGDCPGLNQAIRGAVYKLEALGYECVGIEEGWKGMIGAKTTPLTRDIVEELASRGGTMVGTSRTNPFKKDGGPAAVLKTFKKLKLSALIAMGGEDTLGVAARLFREHAAPVVGVPKTMDNDLSATDFTFGFDTAVSVSMDAAARLIDTGRSHRRCMVLEVMGRHAGWVALYTGIAAGADYVGLPERKVDIKEMASAVKAAVARKKVALVVVSEAVELRTERKKDEPLDEFGHMLLQEREVGEQIAEIIQKETDIETRHATIGHIQRGGHPTLFDRILATRAGIRAAELVHERRYGQMVALRGNDIVPVSLDEATAKLKTVTPEWLSILDTLCRNPVRQRPSRWRPGRSASGLDRAPVREKA